MTTNCQCGNHPPAKPQALELAKLEAVLADCKRRKKAAGVIAPAIACLSESLDASRKGLAVSALTAKLQAATLQARATSAKFAAQIAAAAAAVAPASRPPVKASAAIRRTARREAAKDASRLSPATAANFSDSALSQAATHRSSPASDKAIATAELQRRGFTVHANGVISKSSRKI
jgi:hypothetical protein